MSNRTYDTVHREPDDAAALREAVDLADTEDGRGSEPVDDVLHTLVLRERDEGDVDPPGRSCDRLIVTDRPLTVRPCRASSSALPRGRRQGTHTTTGDPASANAADGQSTKRAML